MFNSEKRREKKMRKLRDQIDDAEYALHKWGFAYKPSETRAVKERIADLKYKLAKLEEQNAR